jgi:DNA-binding IclR family transcriptional regulator
MEPAGSDPQLDLVRETRIAHYAEVVEGISAVAAPVFQGSEIIATMALVGTTASVDAEPGSPMASALREAAENLSTELGFVEPEGRQT